MTSPCAFSPDGPARPAPQRPAVTPRWRLRPVLDAGLPARRGQRRARPTPRAGQRARRTLRGLRGAAPGLPARERPPSHLRPRGRARYGRRLARRAASRTLFFLPRTPDGGAGRPVEARWRARASSCRTTSRASSSRRKRGGGARGRLPVRRRRRLRGRAARAAREARDGGAHHPAEGAAARSTPGCALSRARRRVIAPPRLDLPFDPVHAGDAPTLDALVASCAHRPRGPAGRGADGGATAAERRLERFSRAPLATYDVDRNDPSRDATSSSRPTCTSAC